MPSLTIELDASGKPVVEIEVGMNAAQERVNRDYGGSLSPPIVLRALIDTGCSRTLIEEEHLSRLDLDSVGKASLISATSQEGVVSMNLYAVDLSLVDQPGLVAASLEVGAIASLKGFNVEMLLGRDVLKGGIFTYDGERNRIILSLKSVERPA